MFFSGCLCARPCPMVTAVLVSDRSGTRQERWHERLARQAQESSVHVQTWWVQSLSWSWPIPCNYVWEQGWGARCVSADDSRDRQCACRVTNQWIGTGAAGAVSDSHSSMRGNIRHALGRLSQHIETIRQEGLEALEDRLDPAPGGRRHGRGGGGGGGRSLRVCR